MQLDFTHSITNDTWYPTADLRGFKAKSGGSVDIKQKLVLTFSAPGKITEGDITISSTPWREFKLNIESSEIDNGVGNDSNLLIVFYVQIMPDDFVMQLHRF